MSAVEFRRGGRFRSSPANLREFIDAKECEGNLLRVPLEIDTLDEIGAFIARADDEGIDKPILFEKPRGFDIPVLANTVGARRSEIAAAHRVDAGGELLAKVAARMQAVLEAGGVPPVYADSAVAPCKEVVIKGDDVDLDMLPVLRLNPGDGKGSPDFLEGRFITSLIVSKPREEAHNLSYHRLEVTQKNGGPMRVFRLSGDARSMRDRAFPMAFVLGVTPEFLLAGANKALPHEGNDFAYIGGLRDEPVELVSCETIDVDVPANSEIVIEGILRPDTPVTQGAFASFNGHYDFPRRQPFFEVTAITMRRSPIYQHVHIGRTVNECSTIASFFRAIDVYQDLKTVLPNVNDVYVDPAAGAGFTIHVSMQKRRIGEPRLAMMRVHTTTQGRCKHVFVYDDDIDIRDPRDRDWALAHRFIPDRDLTVIPNVMGVELEPMAQGVMGENSKLGVYDGYPELPLDVRSFMGADCTTPLGIKVMDRVLPVPDIEARIDELWGALQDSADRKHRSPQ
jgi:UbiD family decarboxylase